jgi:hypothetical protein
MQINTVTKKRGGWLTAFLTATLVANTIRFLSFLFFLWFYFYNGHVTYPVKYSDKIPTIIPLIYYIQALVALINIGLIIFLFMWKKWAFFTFCGIAILASIINIIIGWNSRQWIMIPIFLYILMLPKWNLFE